MTHEYCEPWDNEDKTLRTALPDGSFILKKLYLPTTNPLIGFLMRFLLFISFLLYAAPSFSSKLNVIFIVPDAEGPIFWQLVSDVSKVAAKSLNVDLEIIHSDSNRFASKSVIDKILLRSDKPDYLIFLPYLGNTISVFNQIERAKIPFITLEQTFPLDLKKRLLQPREKYKYWLDQINYDNKVGGELLLQAMIKAHFKRYPEKKMYITGIGGDYNGTSMERQAILEYWQKNTVDKKVEVTQVFPMYWNPTMIHERFPLIMRRYPKTNAFWCASDQMALEILKEHQASSNLPIVIGGFDWLPATLEKIKNREITASAGGQFLMVVQALVKIINYQQGAEPVTASALLHQYEVITSENVDLYLSFFEKRLWTKIDFSKYLHKKNSKTTSTLTVENMLVDLRE